jgi:hypothetical protein
MLDLGPAARQMTELLGESRTASSRRRRPAMSTPWANLIDHVGGRYGGFNQQVKDRLDEEFHLIEQHNLAGFFLIYHEIVKMAHEIMVELGRTHLEIPPEERPVLRGRSSSVAIVSAISSGCPISTL